MKHCPDINKLNYHRFLLCKIKLKAYPCRLIDFHPAVLLQFPSQSKSSHMASCDVRMFSPKFVKINMSLKIKIKI